MRLTPKNLFAATSFAALTFGALALADDHKDGEKKAAGDGWTMLFNGKDLGGFHRVNGTANYVVEDGAIVGTTMEGSPNSFLTTAKEYGDFELEFEVMVDPELNSGVQIRSRQKESGDVAEGKNNQIGRYFGPQVEIEGSPGQSANIYGEATEFGWLSEAPKDKTYQHEFVKNGEWNHFRVVAKGPTITTFINGEKVEELTHEEIYKTHPKGTIGFQVHGIKRGTGPYKVMWKNIKIKEL
jgi:hypothetical protein